MIKIGKRVLAFIAAAFLLATAGLMMLPTAFFVSPVAALDAGSKDPAKTKMKPTYRPGRPTYGNQAPAIKQGSTGGKKAITPSPPGSK
jgi:hypothetical protein